MTLCPPPLLLEGTVSTNRQFHLSLGVSNWIPHKPAPLSSARSDHYAPPTNMLLIGIWINLTMYPTAPICIGQQRHMKPIRAQPRRCASAREQDEYVQLRIQLLQPGWSWWIPSYPALQFISCWSYHSLHRCSATYMLRDKDTVFELLHLAHRYAKDRHVSNVRISSRHSYGHPTLSLVPIKQKREHEMRLLVHLYTKVSQSPRKTSISSTTPSIQDTEPTYL